MDPSTRTGNRADPMRFDPNRAEKQHFVGQVGRPIQIVAMWCMLAAALTCGACLLLVIASEIVLWNKGFPRGPFWACLVIFGAMTFVSGWIFVRLFRQQRAANGLTVMPIRFIEGFGLVFMAMICVVAVWDRNFWFLGEGVGICLAMIGIRSLLKPTAPDGPLAENTKDCP